jgi:hypothetical protein
MMDIIKVEENDVDVLSKEDFTVMKNDDFYIQSTISIEKDEPEVSLVCKIILWLFRSSKYFSLYEQNIFTCEAVIERNIISANS